MQSLDNVELGQNIYLGKYINLYGCKIGDNTKIGAFVEIQEKVEIGRKCKISSHSFICSGVTIEDNCFISHGVTFCNDFFPRATNEDGSLKTDKDWQCLKILVKKGASIGSGATILPGITIGEGAMVGAGSIVTKDVEPYSVVIGNPAKFHKWLKTPICP